MNSWDNEETRKKRIDGIKRAWENNPHRRKKASDRLKLKWEDPKYREEMCRMSAETQSSLEYREMKRQQSKEIWSDPERIEKQTSRIKQRWADPELRKRQSQTATKNQSSLHYRKKMSSLVKAALSDLETRSKMSSAATAHWRDPEFYQKQSTQRSKEKNGNWKKGRSFGRYCSKFNNSLKERCRIRFGRKCILCGIDEGDLGRKLDVHHVYSEKKACCEGEMDITSMDILRERLPKTIAKFGDINFSDDELYYIRMIVPMCNICHLKVGVKKYEEEYRETITGIVLNKFNGEYYIPYEEYLVKYKLKTTK